MKMKRNVVFIFKRSIELQFHYQLGSCYLNECDKIQSGVKILCSIMKYV